MAPGHHPWPLLTPDRSCMEMVPRAPVMSPMCAVSRTAGAKSRLHWRISSWTVVMVVFIGASGWGRSSAASSDQAGSSGSVVGGIGSGDSSDARLDNDRDPLGGISHFVVDHLLGDLPAGYQTAAGAVVGNPPAHQWRPVGVGRRNPDDELGSSRSGVADRVRCSLRSPAGS
jgi:hypothetical protein